MEGKIESFLDLSTPQAKKAFQKHLQECHQDEDFSQAAARIVREAAKD